MYRNRFLIKKCKKSKLSFLVSDLDSDFRKSWIKKRIFSREK
nr:MAG TPA: hypothetical protein [Caudoviricetes sp.]